MTFIIKLIALYCICEITNLLSGKADLYGVSSGVEGEPEGLIERGLPVMSTNSGLLLNDPLLSGHIHHIQLHIQVWWPVG